jgi:hypothetical protein
VPLASAQLAAARALGRSSAPLRTFSIVERGVDRVLAEESAVRQRFTEQRTDLLAATVIRPKIALAARWH